MPPGSRVRQFFGWPLCPEFATEWVGKVGKGVGNWNWNEWLAIAQGRPFPHLHPFHGFGPIQPGLFGLPSTQQLPSARASTWPCRRVSVPSTLQMHSIPIITFPAQSSKAVPTGQPGFARRSTHCAKHSDAADRQSVRSARKRLWMAIWWNCWQRLALGGNSVAQNTFAPPFQLESIGREEGCPGQVPNGFDALLLTAPTGAVPQARPLPESFGCPPAQQQQFQACVHPLSAFQPVSLSRPNSAIIRPHSHCSIPWPS